MKKSFISLFIAFMFSPSWAQSPAPSVGTIQSVQGLVTISQGTTLGNAASGTPLTNGAIVVSTCGASTFIQLRSGCSVPLSPRQSVTVNTELSCDQLLNSVQQLADQCASAGGFAAGAGAGFLAVPIVAFALDRNSQPSQSLSGK